MNYREERGKEDRKWGTMSDSKKGVEETESEGHEWKERRGGGRQKVKGLE